MSKQSEVTIESTDADKSIKKGIMKLNEKAKQNKANQSKMKNISEKKKESEERRKIANAERQLAQKEYHILAK